MTVNRQNGITPTTKEEHKGIIEAMRPYLNTEEKPQIGIFWYDAAENDFFGVNSLDYDQIQDINNRRTYPKLHKTIWQKQRYRGKDKHYFGDYTMVPRGRVNYENGEFVVYVGSWIDEYNESVTELLKNYFNLKQFRFKKDIHWDLGHGWSEEDVFDDL
ncbi:MAG: hypothetical protein J6M30_04775 [Bacteroidales bacterium]|nr:hypothetical protein [Bacteroidales bacterium]